MQADDAAADNGHIERAAGGANDGHCRAEKGGVRSVWPVVEEVAAKTERGSTVTVATSLLYTDRKQVKQSRDK